ncbi:MAG: hypothetical protein ACRD0P_03060 [Stackebrandtia sp.]
MDEGFRMEFASALSGLNATSRSPDDTVRVVMSHADGTRVRLRPGAFQRHSEHSLAEATGAALSRAVRGFFEGVEQGNASLRETYGGPNDVDFNQMIHEALSPCEFSATSPRGNIGIRWRGSSDIRLKLRPRTLERLDEAGFLEEVDIVFGEVVRQYRLAYSTENARLVIDHMRPLMERRYT